MCSASRSSDLCECCGVGCAPRWASTTSRWTVFEPTSSTPSRMRRTLAASPYRSQRRSRRRSVRCPSTSRASGSSSPTPPTPRTSSAPTSPGCARAGRASSAAAATAPSPARPAPAAATTARTSPTGRREAHEALRRAAHPRRLAALRRGPPHGQGRHGQAALLREGARRRARSGARPASSTAPASSPTARATPAASAARCTGWRCAPGAEPARDQARGVLAAAGAPRAGVGRPPRRHPHPALDPGRVRPPRLGRGRPRPGLVLHVRRPRRTSAASRCTCPTAPSWSRSSATRPTTSWRRSAPSASSSALSRCTPPPPQRSAATGERRPTRRWWRLQ